MQRDYNPLTTNLVVADPDRTEKTICLAVSPSLKAYGIPGRARLFEVVQKVKEVNAARKCRAPGQTLSGKSRDATELKNNPSLELDYVIAKPHMALYMKISTQIYQIYLRYVAAEDIHVYSIDEVFIDATNYLQTYGLTPRELAMKMVQDVLQTTGITATAGIGTNLYLSKIAMDIVAKHIQPDKDGVRIAELDEQSYRRQLWTHRPLKDFWRIGRGYAKRLEQRGLYTMGDIARCSVGRPDDYYNEDLLYRMFGINAELLIDHAWGWEPCTIADIKQFRPSSNSIGSGQVLQCPYVFEKARLIVREMTDLLVLDMVEKGRVTDQIVLNIWYDADSLIPSKDKPTYQGAVSTDFYGRKVPKPAHGSARLEQFTSSTKVITDAVMALFDAVVNPDLLVRRVYVTANHVIDEHDIPQTDGYEQMNLFTDNAAEEKKCAEEQAAQAREKKMQQTLIEIQKKFGKNAILKGMNLEKGATTKERNRQIGGHKA